MDFFIATPGHEKVLTLQNPAEILQKNPEYQTQKKIRKSQYIPWNMDEILNKIYKDPNIPLRIYDFPRKTRRSLTK